MKEETESGEKAPGEDPSLSIDFSGIGLSKSPAKMAFLLLGIIVILVFVISGLSRCSRDRKEESRPVVVEPDKELRTAVEPPLPYFN